MVEGNYQNPFGVNLTKRYVSEGAEEELFKTHKVGNSGSIELVDYMGGDGMVERVATAGHGASIFPNEHVSQKGLIYYLADNGIYQPFKSVQLKFSIQSPISVALDFVYDPNANVNEYSLRYSAALETSRKFDQDEVRDLIDDPTDEKAEQVLGILNDSRENSFSKYNELIGLDMARELARSVLGIDQDTRYFWKQDLKSLAGFVESQDRRDNSITEDYVDAMREIIQKVAPLSWNALMEDIGYPNHLSIETNPKDSEVVDGSLSPSSWGINETRRRCVPGVEDILFESESFLDHGKFQVVDYMGDDGSMAEAARTSYGKGTKTLQDDKRLVNSLIRDLHTTPTEMTQLAFEAKSPVFSDPRQAGRHRTLPFHGFMGYTPIGSEVYFPEDSEFKMQDRVNRQGRGKDMETSDLDTAKSILRETFDQQAKYVEELEELGASEELIRNVKGVGGFTRVWRTGDANNLAKFLVLRQDKHAQMEVRAYANLVARAMSVHTPEAYASFKSNLIDGMRLSSKEIGVISTLYSKDSLNKDFDFDDVNNFKGAGFVIPVDKDDPSKGKKLGREGEAFKSKLQRILYDF